ncbi:MAG: cellulose synthase operon protein YhjQ [Pseudomonadaceae bacterium]|nr:cellulose synthase operon protein YhjQ [Pseudomonadaceae bacterium]
MSTSSDISRLFSKFGSGPSQYQELLKEQSQQNSLPCEPDLAQAKDSELPSIAAYVPDSGTALPEESRVKYVDLKSARNALEVEAASALSRSAGMFDKALDAGVSLRSKLDDLSQARQREADALPVFFSRPRPSLSHISIIAVVSGKGGVGKSTVAANFAVALQREGQSVLAVDLDPQNALHHHFGLEPEAGRASWTAGIAQVDALGSQQENYLHSASGVRLLPYGAVDESRRRAFEAQLEEDPDWLACLLADLQLADGTIVILDTPPGPSIYLRQVLAVANLALVVSLSDAASYNTLPMMDSLIKTYAGDRPEFFGASYLINQVERSRKLSEDITRIMCDVLGDKVLGLVRRDPSITEALAYNRSVLDYDPRGLGCHDLLSSAKAVLLKLTERGQLEQAV